MAKIYGQLEKAQLENLAAEPASAPLGYVYHDTVSDCAKVKTSDGFKKVLGVAGTAKVLTTSAVPSSAGLAASVGSLAMHEGTGQVFAKTGAADTAWSELTTLADGSVTTAKLADGSVTTAKLAAANYQIVNIASVTTTSITGILATITITTSGRPVSVGFKHNTQFFNGYFSAEPVSPTTSGLIFGVAATILRNASDIRNFTASFTKVPTASAYSCNNSFPCEVFSFIDFPPAGTHTYTTFIGPVNPSRASLAGAAFFVMEL